MIADEGRGAKKRTPVITWMQDFATDGWSILNRNWFKGALIMIAADVDIFLGLNVGGVPLCSVSSNF